MTFASVCVLSYERPQYLRACLESLRDAGEPFELIIHDDGSRDSQVKPFLGHLLDEGLISNLILRPPGENEGVGESVRKCFAAAQGDILIKVDQDLVFTPGWLIKARRMLEDPLVGCAGFFPYHHEPCDVEKTKILGLDPPDGFDHFYVVDFVGSAFAVRRGTYEEHGPIESHSTAFAEDVVLKNAITGSVHTEHPAAGGLFCALPNEALCVNVGFGVPNSTVNRAEGGTAEIRTGPRLMPATWT